MTTGPIITSEQAVEVGAVLVKRAGLVAHGPPQCLGGEGVVPVDEHGMIESVIGFSI